MIAIAQALLFCLGSVAGIQEAQGAGSVALHVFFLLMVLWLDGRCCGKCATAWASRAARSSMSDDSPRQDPLIADAASSIEEIEPEMRRRKFVALLGAAPLLGIRRAQRAAGRRLRESVSPDTYAFNVAAFREALAKAGFIEGTQRPHQYRWARGDYSRLPALAARLAALNVAGHRGDGRHRFGAGSESGDEHHPDRLHHRRRSVGHGLVAERGQPGATSPASTCSRRSLSAKRIELLTEIAPKARRIALVMNPDNFTAKARDRTEGIAGARAQSRSLRGQRAEARRDRPPSPSTLRLEADSYVTASDPLILDRAARSSPSAGADGLPASASYAPVRHPRLAPQLLGRASPGCTTRRGPSIGGILKGRNPRSCR